jgi:hypothetical protein
MTSLKLVKTNERETEVPQFSKYGSPRGTKKVKEHDLELHHPETGEPIFSVQADTGYGSKGKYNLKWHPYMTSQFPDLATSHEHGSGHFDYNHMQSTGGKDSLPHVGGGKYERAARDGFKDPIPHTKHLHPTESNPAAHAKIFRDPDTNDPITTRHADGSVKFHTSYLDKHGIDREIVNQPYARHYTGSKYNGGYSHKGGGNSHDAYQLAKHIHAQKGLKFSAIGNKTGGDGGSWITTYKGHKDLSDEDLSRSHEERITRQYPGNEHYQPVQIVRHSPKAFIAKYSYGSGAREMHSIAHEGRLTEATHDHDYEYSRAQKTDVKW